MPGIYIYACPGTPKLNQVDILSERYFENFIDITLEWLEEDYVTYKLVVSPEVAVMFSDVTTAHLTLFYNVQFTVHVMGTLCGHNTTFMKQLYYYGEFGELLRTSWSLQNENNFDS